MTPINVCTAVKLVVNRFAQNVYVYYAYGRCCSQKVVPQNLGSQLASQKVMASFELALVQSLVLQFPNSEIQGCFFHFFQYLWMKVQFIGLTDLYKNDPVTRCFIWKSAALAFVPLPIAWSGVNADVPAIPKGDALVDYFQKRPGLMVTSF